MEAVQGALVRDLSRTSSTSSASTNVDKQGQRQAGPTSASQKVRSARQSSKSAPHSLTASPAAYSHAASGPWQVPPTAPASPPTASARCAACPGSLPSRPPPSPASPAALARFGPTCASVAKSRTRALTQPLYIITRPHLVLSSIAGFDLSPLAVETSAQDKQVLAEIYKWHASRAWHARGRADARVHGRGRASPRRLPGAREAAIADMAYARLQARAARVLAAWSYPTSFGASLGLALGPWFCGTIAVPYNDKC